MIGEATKVAEVKGSLWIDFSEKKKRSRRGKNAKKRGSGIEREVADAHKDDFGVFAQRVPLSGAMAGYPADVTVRESGKPLRLECKSRKNANGFKSVRDWLGENDLLVLREMAAPGQKKPPYIVTMPWNMYGALLKTWDQLAQNITSCAACGEDHPIVFLPSEEEGIERSGICKNTGVEVKMVNT